MKKSHKFLAERLRNNAKDLATVIPTDLASSRVLKMTSKDLEEAATTLEELEESPPSDTIRAPSELDLLCASSDDARDEAEPLKLRTKAGDEEIVTSFWAPCNQYITWRRLDGGSAQVKGQADTVRQAAINHIKVALLAKEGKLPPAPPPLKYQSYPSDPSLN